MVTRWYRALEIASGLPYTKSVDVWAAGCVLYELVNRRILFQAKEDSTLLYVIHQRLVVDECTITRFRANVWTATGEGGAAARALAERMLSTSPSDRPLAHQALRDAYFAAASAGGEGGAAPSSSHGAHTAQPYSLPPSHAAPEPPSS